MLHTQVLQDSPARHASVLPVPFACSWTNAGEGAAWVRVAGELDTATSPQLVRTLSAAQQQACLVVVDLRRVAFADSSAIHALLDATARARRKQDRLVILRGPPNVDRIFALPQVRDAVEIVDLDATQPPVMALLRLAEQRDGGSAGAGDRPLRTG